MKTYIFVLKIMIICAFCNTAMAQGWEQIYPNFPENGTWTAEKVVPADDGGFHVLVTTSVFSGAVDNYYLMKIDSDGEVETVTPFFEIQQHLAVEMIKTANGDLVILSKKKDPAQYSTISFIRVDSDYNILNETTIDQNQPRGIVELANGEFWITGSGGDFPVNSFLQKVDAQGQLIGQPIYDGFEDNYVIKALPHTNGGVRVIGYAKINGVSPSKTVINEYDTDGTLTNQLVYDSGTQQGIPNDVINTADGGMLITGRIGSSMPYLIKTDAAGTEIWRQEYATSNFIYLGGLGEKVDGTGYRIHFREGAGDGYGGLIETDLQGEWVWKKEYAADYLNQGQDLLMLSDGGTLIASQRATQAGTIFGNQYFPYLIRTDENGDTFNSSITGTVSDDTDEDCLQDGIVESIGQRVTAFQNDISIVSTTVDAAGNYVLPANPGLYKVAVELPNFLWSSCQDSLDVTVTAANITSDQSFVIAYNNEPLADISGYVFSDYDDDCVRDSFETIGYENWTVYLDVQEDGNSETFEVITDETGFYTFNNLTPFTNGATALIYFEQAIGSGLNCEFPCVQEQFIGPFAGTSIEFNNGVTCDTLPLCSIMSVSMSSFQIRPCQDGTYFVNYCNIGGLTAEDAYLDITIDPALAVTDSSLPWVSQSGNVYTIEVGDLQSNECGSFFINFFAPCEDEVGTTYCSEVYAFPDTPCFMAGEAWDESEIELSVICENDSVRFSIQNIGIGDMLSPLEYIVIEDNVLLHSDQPFQLTAGETMTVVYPASGTFYRMEAMQADGFPGFDTPISWIEGCGSADEISLGIVNQYPLGDEDSWHDIFCLESTNSYDPNDKNGFPRGVDDEHFIDANEPLEYRIRFQNTGTADALFVEIRDTLDVNVLNPLTLRPGASSHPYTWDMEGNGVVVFRFANINLAPESVDEAGSQGFVQLKVSQQLDLPIGTEINNSAAIYFDNNAPIITNETLHTIGEPYLILGLDNAAVQQLHKVVAFPNPTHDLLYLEVKNLETTQHLRVAIYDLLGRKISETPFENKSTALDMSGFSTGTYLFKIYQEGEVIGVGKVLKF